MSPRRTTAPASRSAATVEQFLAELDHPDKPAVLALRALILGADPRVTEGIKWNAPTFSTTADFATFHLRGKSGIQLVLHFGAVSRPDSSARDRIADPTGMLAWRAPDRAIVTFRGAADVERRKGEFLAVLRQWIREV